MFPSNLLPSTYSGDRVNNSPKQAFILKTLPGPNPFSPLQSDCCVHYMLMARAVLQPTLAAATQTGLSLCCLGIMLLFWHYLKECASPLSTRQALSQAPQHRPGAEASQKSEIVQRREAFLSTRDDK